MNEFPAGYYNPSFNNYNAYPTAATNGIPNSFMNYEPNYGGYMESSFNNFGPFGYNGNNQGLPVPVNFSAQIILSDDNASSQVDPESPPLSQRARRAKANHRRNENINKVLIDLKRMTCKSDPKHMTCSQSSFEYVTKLQILQNTIRHIKKLKAMLGEDEQRKTRKEPKTSLLHELLLKDVQKDKPQSNSFPNFDDSKANDNEGNRPQQTERAEISWLDSDEASDCFKIYTQL